MLEEAKWVFELAKQLVAIFGFFWLLFAVALPLLWSTANLVLFDAPDEWYRWQVHRAQQRKLGRLQRRVDILTETQHERRQQAKTAKASGAKSLRKDIASGEARHRGEKQVEKQHDPVERPRRHRLSIYSTAKKSRTKLAEQERGDR